jgi:hypothetical protein
VPYRSATSPNIGACRLSMNSYSWHYETGGKYECEAEWFKGEKSKESEWGKLV